MFTIPNNKPINGFQLIEELRGQGVEALGKIHAVAGKINFNLDLDAQSTVQSVVDAHTPDPAFDCTNLRNEEFRLPFVR